MFPSKPARPATRPSGLRSSHPLCEDTEEGSQNHGDSHARQDPVATRALHTAQVSTSSPTTKRISEAGDRPLNTTALVLVATQPPWTFTGYIEPTVGSLPNKKASQRQGGRHPAGARSPSRAML